MVSTVELFIHKSCQTDDSCNIIAHEQLCSANLYLSRKPCGWNSSILITMVIGPGSVLINHLLVLSSVKVTATSLQLEIKLHNQVPKQFSSSSGWLTGSELGYTARSLICSFKQWCSDFKDNMEYLQHDSKSTSWYELPLYHLFYVYPVINEVLLLIKIVEKNEML